MAQLRGTAPERRSEDPLLQRMLATHIHCGQAMQLAAADETPSARLPHGKNDSRVLTYRCACGFSFDQRQE